MIGLVAKPIGLPGAQPNVPDDAPPDYRFKIEVLARGLAQPLLLQLAPDGRIFFNELGREIENLETGRRDGRGRERAGV